MNIIVNTSNLKSGGALQVAISVLYEWNKIYKSHQFHVILSPQMHDQIVCNKFDKNFHFYYCISNPSSSIFSLLRFKKLIKDIEKKSNIDIGFSFFGPTLWRPKYKHIVGFANGFYLFDNDLYIKNYLKKNYILKYRIRQKLLFFRLKLESDVLWTETNFSKTELSNKGFNEKNIVVVSNTYNELITPLLKEKSHSNTFTFIYVSAYYAHKNFEILVDAAKIIAQKNIPCCIQVTLPNDEFKKITKNQNLKNLINLGPIKFNELNQRYENADAIIMPSLLETSSANFPEAMRKKLPILAANTRASIASCGNAGLYFDANNPQELVVLIQKIISDTTLRKQLIQAGEKKLIEFGTPQSRAENLFELITQSSNTRQ